MSGDDKLFPLNNMFGQLTSSGGPSKESRLAQVLRLRSNILTVSERIMENNVTSKFGCANQIILLV